MACQMARPSKHPKTGVYRFRMAVPEALRAAVGKRELIWSLKTKDHKEAKERYPLFAAKAAAILNAAKASGGHPFSLTQKDAIALAGEWYLARLEEWGDNPGDAEIIQDWLSDEAQERQTKKWLPTAHKLVSRHSIVIDAASMHLVASALYDANLKLQETLLRRANGDFRADQYSSGLPPFSLAIEKSQSDASDTLQGLVAAWATERKPAPKTEYDWKRKVDRLANFLGHNDPARIAKADIVRWKDALLKDNRHSKTVENYLAALRSLFAWAVDNERMKTNPAAGVKVAAKRHPGDRRRPYDDKQASLLLKEANKLQGHKKWVVWLLAYTGARMEEICQSLVSDVRQDGEICYLDINSDGPNKSLKNTSSARKLPLHAALIEAGFIDYVKSLPEGGPLFPGITKDRFGRRGGNFSKYYSRWQKSLGISDKRLVAHSWRHRFKDTCRAAQIIKEVHDALTGHKAPDVGSQYGLGFDLQHLNSEINKITPILVYDSL